MAGPDTGYFGPDSLTWKVNKEFTVLAGGVRALLMHAAHPLAAAAGRRAGVPRDDPWSLLMAAQSLRLLLPFGTRRGAEEAAERINRRRRAAAGTDPATGEAYDPLHPDLLLWEHACIEQSTMVFYELTVRPMTEWQHDAYHREHLTAAALMLLPAERVPATYAATDAYVGEVIASGRLMVTEAAREVADLIVGGKVPFRFRPAWALVSFAAVGTLPPGIRRLYGFRWSPGRQRLLDALLWIVKRTRPLVPERIRLIPAARAAGRRLAGDGAG